MKTIAIIPARGGSKGVPRKNIKLLAGKPLLAYTVEAAIQSSVIDRVIVSTEDKEIAGIARKYGAEVLERPAELATDEAPTEPVMLYVVRYLEGEEQYKPDIIMLLQVTSPLRDANNTKEAMGEFFENGYDSLLSVCPTHVSLWREGDEGPVSFNYDYRRRTRRQDSGTEYRENGAIYITSYEILIREQNRLGGKIGLYVMKEEDSLEIDSEFDFWLCEQVLINRGGDYGS